MRQRENSTFKNVFKKTFGIFFYFKINIMPVWLLLKYFSSTTLSRLLPAVIGCMEGLAAVLGAD
jgi:hypothetical protein